jgi:surface antigen
MEPKVMNQRSLSKTVILAALCVSISGCLYDNASTSSSNSQASNLTAGTNSNPNGSTKAPDEIRTANGGPLGGYIEQFMDANDKSKMARALDGSLGKANSWQNPVSGASFAVTPLRKVAAGSGDGICRAYSISMNKGGVNDKVGGTACIGDDGLWHTAS